MRDDQIEIPQPPPGRPGDRRVLARTDSTESARSSLTWNGHRRRIFLSVLGITGIALACLFWLVPPTDVIQPGELSRSHAQILADVGGEQRCGACHLEPHPFSVDFWRTTGHQTSATRQGELCLNCHRKTIPENLAFVAHNAPRSVREELGREIRLASGGSSSRHGSLSLLSLPAARLNQDSIACRTCHREHHGTEANLRELTDAQCQSCHNQQFDSFGGAHPEFKGWPYGNGGQIAFDHASHMNQHFPAANNNSAGSQRGIPFDCSRCHPGTQNAPAAPPHLLSWSEAGEPVRTSSYDVACASCHNDALRTRLNETIDLLALPILPPDSVPGAGAWPEQNIGFADGTISPPTELLLRADTSAATALRCFASGDVSRPLSKNPADVQADLKTIAIGLTELLADFSSGEHQLIDERLTTVGVSPDTFHVVLRSLPPQWIRDTTAHWFGEMNPDDGHEASFKSEGPIRLALADSEELLPIGQTVDPLMLPDESAEDPLAEIAPSRSQSPPPAGSRKPFVEMDVSSGMRLGGWIRNDKNFMLTYKPSGHSDPIIRGLIETFAQLGEGDPLKKRFFRTPAIKSCIECHPSATSVPAIWHASSSKSSLSGFTKFAHTNHLKIGGLSDCKHCHQVRTSPTALAAEQEFLPMQKMACAQCHSSAAAGDNCTTCHRYHIHGP